VSRLVEEIETMLTTSDGTTIFVRSWAPGYPQRVLVCVQGLGGHGGYYEELAHHLGSVGTILIAPDLRGHGHSEGKRGDIDYFDRYLGDVDAAINWATVSWPDKPIFVLGESMGASIAIQYIANFEYHITSIPITGLVLVSPVLSPAIHPTVAEVIRYIRLLLFAPSRPAIAVTGREEMGSRDPAFNERLRADPHFVRHVSARFMTRLTFWLWQSKRKAYQINLPLLVLLGGRDYVARRTGTSAFLRNVPARGQRIVTFPSAYHSLLHDPDTQAIIKVLASWLTAHSRI
jgi:acylglycerol lipase